MTRSAMSPNTLSVEFVCSGNICRSPMGHVILQKLVDDAGLSDQVRVTSSGTGDWHVGEAADPRTIRTLAEHGYDGSHHRARYLDPSTFDSLDLILAADQGHLRRLRTLAGGRSSAAIRLMREFDPAAVAAGTLETDDPWYGSERDFERCFLEVEAACRGLLDHIRSELTA